MLESTLVIWIVVLFLSGAVELFTLSLVSIWFCIGALVAMALSLLKFSVAIQILGFIIGSLITFLIFRPTLKRYITSKKSATNADRVIDKKGEVIKVIDDLEMGQVKVQGQVWTAKSSDGESIQVGEIVDILAIEGVKVVVKKRR